MLHKIVKSGVVVVIATGALIAGGVVPVGAVLGSASAAPPDLSPSPTKEVEVVNGSTHPVPVNGSVHVDNLPTTQQVTGTVNVGNLPTNQQISGTVGLDPNKNTVNLDATDSAHLANIDGTVGKLKFSNDGKLLTQSDGKQVVTFFKSCHSPNDYDAYTCDFGRTVYVTHLTVDSETDRVFVSLLPGAGGDIDIAALGETRDGEKDYDFSTPVPATSVGLTCRNPFNQCSGATGPWVYVQGY